MDGTCIYAKTPAGSAEVAARAAGLCMQTRRVLIMMDGRRTVGELAVLVRPGEIEAIVGRLEAAGLARRLGEDDAAVAATPVNGNAGVANVSAAPEDRDTGPLTLDEAKRRAARELNERIGPEADGLAIRIESCRTIDEFRERIRDAERFVATALGREAAQDYLRALKDGGLSGRGR